MTAEPLEPVLAHGARMSWAGLLRPGDEFAASRRSRLATVRAERGPPLQRYYGGWSERYRRFTSNLSSPRLHLEVHEPGAAPRDGILAVVHWVDRATLVGNGPGSVAAGDGWPAALWDAFLSVRDGLGGESVGEGLRRFATSERLAELPIVAEWRRRIQDGGTTEPPSPSSIGTAWVPVPVAIDSEFGPRVAIASWSPSPLRFGSVGEALASRFAEARGADVESQARYYLECRLAALHGVRFSADDRLIDRAFEAGPAVRRLHAAMTTGEERRIGDPAYGRLDRRDARVSGPSGR